VFVSSYPSTQSAGGSLPLPLKSGRPARQHPGRQQLPAELPREEQVIVCSPDQCVCGKCGKETTVIGYETSEQLNVEPARYFVRLTKCEKRARTRNRMAEGCTGQRQVSVIMS
jgi:transposase